MRSKRFTVYYYYPGYRIQNQFCTQSALSPLPGEHFGQSPFDRRAHANSPQYRPHPTGLAEGQRVIVLDNERNRTWVIKMGVERPHQYTTTPPLINFKNVISDNL